MAMKKYSEAIKAFESIKANTPFLSSQVPYLKVHK